MIPVEFFIIAAGVIGAHLGWFAHALAVRVHRRRKPTIPVWKP